MEKYNEFKAELKALLEKYNATIFCNIEGDTHGLINTMIVEIDRNEHKLCYGEYIDSYELRDK